MIILTEKPSVARDIAAALKNFKFVNGIYVNGKDCIISARGHLLSSYEPQEYDPKWQSWNKTVQELPIIPEPFLYKENPSTKNVLLQIKDCFKKFDSSEFILATDAEREGEVIGAEILNYVGFSDYSKAKRFWVSEALTPEVVLKGLSQAKPLNEYKSYKEAGFARAKADWLIGINFTRLLTVNMGNKKLFSFGRVQTAILGCIYLRDKNIKNFKPQTYYQLSCKVQKDDFSFNLLYTKNENNKFNQREELDSIKQTIGNSLIVKDISSQSKKENPPQLFNITGLQKYCSNKFQLTPQQTLDCAQELYEKHKCLSYPRTPSVVLGDDNVELFKSKFQLISEVFPDLAKKCDVSKISGENKRIFNSAKLTDHHALIPLNKCPETATENERNVYNAVVLRFLQTIMPDCEYDVISITTESNNNIFKGTGRSYKNKGWKSFEKSDEQELETETFPSSLKNGDELIIIQTDVLEKQTVPKKHFTNASLLSLMENPKAEDIEKTGKLVGLGTPATRASIIEDLKVKGYIQQKKQNLLITESGIFLIETIIKIPSLKDFISLSTTTKWEEQLQSEPEVFLKNIKTFIKTEIPKITITEKWAVESLGKCPLCKTGNVAEGKNSFYCDRYKEGCKFSIGKNICNAKINPSDIKLLINGKITNYKKMKSVKTGKDFSAKLKYQNGKIEFIN